jgi:hypothetical protein
VRVASQYRLGEVPTVSRAHTFRFFIAQQLVLFVPFRSVVGGGGGGAFVGIAASLSCSSKLRKHTPSIRLHTEMALQLKTVTKGLQAGDYGILMQLLNLWTSSMALQFTQSFQPHDGSRFHSASNRNEYPEDKGRQGA